MESKRKQKHNVLRFACFLFLAGIMAIALTNLLVPSFASKREDSVHKMYEQPSDTVQVLCAGGSTLLCGFSPDYLYETFGIASYNICSSNQATASSLYLLKEIMKSQSNIKTVVLDAAPLVSKEKDDVFSRRAMAIATDMRPSLNKVEYIVDVSSNYEGINVFEELIPIFKYHSRWNKLTNDDFNHLSFYDFGNYAHGQLIYSESYKSNISKNQADEFNRNQNDGITEEKSFDDEELKASWNEKNIEYFVTFVEYCAENDIDILLLKTPWNEWGDLQHDSVQLLAETYNVSFLDMSLPAIMDECNLSYANDYYDGKHMILTGSIKASNYVGQYLRDHFDLDDKRGDARFEFMTEDLEVFHRALEDAQLLTCMNLEDYLNLLDNDRYTVFIAVKGEAADNLSNQARAQFESLGLPKLANLHTNESYLGILENGICLTEQTNADGNSISITGTYENYKVVIEKQNLQRGASLKSPLRMESIGSDSSSKASIHISDSEKSENNRGINITVYENKKGISLDHSSFDTHVGSARTSDLPPNQSGN